MAHVCQTSILRDAWERGQAVTVQLLGASSQVIGTFYAIVQPNGSFALNIPQAQLPADGNYTLTAPAESTAELQRFWGEVFGNVDGPVGPTPQTAHQAAA